MYQARINRQSFFTRILLTYCRQGSQLVDSTHARTEKLLCVYKSGRYMELLEGEYPAEWKAFHLLLGEPCLNNVQSSANSERCPVINPYAVDSCILKQATTFRCHPYHELKSDQTCTDSACALHGIRDQFQVRASSTEIYSGLLLSQV